jgi:hypothetical protein
LPYHSRERIISSLLAKLSIQSDISAKEHLNSGKEDQPESPPSQSPAESTESEEESGD